MTDRRWPYPGESPVVRARRVAAAYRQLAETADPDGCAALDRRVVSWGEPWAVPHATAAPDPDKLLTAGEAAELAGIQPDSIGALRRRGRLPAAGWDGTGYRYRARDIYDLARVARRRPTPTDRIGTNGTTVP